MGDPVNIVLQGYRPGCNCVTCQEYRERNAKVDAAKVDDGKEVWLRMNGAASATLKLDEQLQKRRARIEGMRNLAHNIARLLPQRSVSAWRDVAYDTEQLSIEAIELLSDDERTEVAAVLRAALERVLREYNA